MTIVITGASKGIGFAIAERFARGVPELRLAICSRNADALRLAANHLQSIAPNAHILSEACDVSNEQDVAQFANRVEAEFGAVDVVINNAGYALFKPVQDISEDEFDGILASNLRGPFLVTKAFLPGMRARKSGSIVTISSLAGKNGFVGGAAYCASKHGVRGLMQSLFLECREDNVRVMTIFPGSVDTEFFSAANVAAGKTTLDRNSISNKMANRALAASDVAESVWLAVSLPASATISELDIRPTNPKGV